MPTTEADVQGRIDAITWYHEMDFGNGLRSRITGPDSGVHRLLWEAIEAELDGIDFRGKSVLDIGCWDGYWSFFAERRGARSVLATDDRTQNWADGSGLLLAHDLLNSDVEIDQDCSVYRLDSLGRKFDIILCLGVHYHLHDLYFALAQIRHCCHADTLVVFEGNGLRPWPPESAVPPKPGTAHPVYIDFHNPGGKLTPSFGAFCQLLRAAYLRLRSHKVLLTGRPKRRGWRWRRRACWAALTGRPDRLIDYSEPGRAHLPARVFLTCTPFTGANDIHPYPPPFGLAAYDPRFAAAGDRCP